jgi:hydrogenase maturation protein HypF
LWGGELLVADYRESLRVASFEAVPLLGGDRAAREPWRSLFAQLRHAGIDLERWADHPVVARTIGRRTPVLEGVLASGTLSPRCSAVGRLFDAAAATIGLWADGTTYEGQAAIALEALVDPAALAWARGAESYPFRIRRDGLLPVVVAGEALAAMLDDVGSDVSAPRIAARFHVSLARTVAALAAEVRGPLTTAALSGGVWQNRILVELVAELLRGDGWTVLLHRHVPPNDGGIAFGQAAIAAAAAVAHP